MTELDAVNQCLATIGEAAVSTLEDVSYNYDAARALQTLRSITTRVLDEGWWFNSQSLTVTPDINGKLPIPPEVLKIEGSTYVKEGHYAIPFPDRSQTFTQPVTMDVCLDKSFDLLPFAAQDYITITAALRLQNISLGSDSVYGYTAADLVQARGILLSAELTARPMSSLDPSTNGASFIQNGARGLVTRR